MKTKILTFFAASLALFLAASPALAQTTTIQLAHGTASPVSTLKPGQPFVDTTDSGATYHFWMGGWGSLTGTNVDIFAALLGGGVSSLNSLTGGLNLLAGAGLSVTTSTPNVTYGLTTSGVTAGTYAYPASIQADTYGRILSITAGSAPPTSLPPNGAAGGDLSGSYPGPRVIAFNGIPFSGAAPTTGYFIGYNGSALTYIAPSGTAGGTVTSAGVSAPSDIFTVTGSPITTTGTIAITTNSQNANQVWAGPASGGATTPGFRALVAADIPSLSAVYEPVLGNPSVTGYVLSSTTGGVRSWVANAGGGGSGTVTSISGSGGSTGLTLTGGPITTSGTLTLGGTLALGYGGTGQTSASAAINALVPSQTGQSGNFLTTNGTSISWASTSGGGGSLSGDVTGPTAATVVGKLQGTPISASAPNTGNMLVFNGMTWGGSDTGGDLNGHVTSATVTAVRGQSWDSTAPTTGQLPHWSGTNWTPTTLTFSGGDLSGSYPAPVVAQIQGTAVSATAPTTANQVMGYDGSTWRPVNLVDGETPSVTTSGLNTVLTLAHTPLAASVHLYAGSSFVALMRIAPSQYTVSTNTITIATATLAGAIDFTTDYRW